jgi:transcriptional regulator of heat shock response
MSKLKFIKSFIKIKDFFQYSCEILRGLLVKVLLLFTMKFRTKKIKNYYFIVIKKRYLYSYIKI